MIRLTAKTRILLAADPVDFRRQIDGLSALCQHHLTRDPRDGSLYVFINRARTMIRILHHDGSGYWLATKRLSRGRYEGWPSVTARVSPIEASRLMHIIKLSLEQPDTVGV